VSELPNPATRPTLTTAEVAELWRTTRDHVWRMAREGTAPVTPLRLGSRQLRWPTRPVLQSLGLDGEELAEDRAPPHTRGDGDPKAAANRRITAATEDSAITRGAR
jgi:predicted DNA-binding transcriptional regulator AlpA